MSGERSFLRGPLARLADGGVGQAASCERGRLGAPYGIAPALCGGRARLRFTD